MIYFIVAGYETSASSGLTPSVWAHAWRTTGTGLTAGTKNVQRWSQNGEYYNASIQMTMGVIAHELGHQMGGLPDLYDTSGTNGAMGIFSLMAGGSWGGDYTGSAWETGGTTPTALDAWSREFLGWATPVTPTSSGTLTLAHPLSSQSAAYKFVSPLISSTEYFLVENRYPTGWDLGIKRQLGSGWLGGLLITHIDITSGTYGSNDINNYTVNNVAGGGHQGVVPVQASTTSCDMLTSSSRGCSTTLYYSSNNASWGPVTTPNSNYYSGTATNFSLTGISAQAATMTGSISFTPPVTKTLTVAKDGTGSGTVSSSPAGISCGSTCSASYLQNEAVTLTAVSDSGSVFSGWSGGGCSGTGTCVVSLANDTTVTASFATATTLINENFDGVSTPSLPAGWLTTPVEPAAVWATHVGTGAPSGIAAHSGANLVYFNSWSINSGYSAALTSPVISLAGTSNNAVSFWMYRDAGYSTYADKVEVYVNTAANLTGATLLGTIYRYTGSSPTVSGAGWYNYSFAIPDVFAGTTNHLIFRGISGYGNDIHIDDISVSGVPVVITQHTLTVNHAYTAAGAIKGGGSINGSGISCSAVNGGSKTGTCSVSLDDGSTVTLAAAADANSTFNGWTGGGCSGTDGCSFTIASDTTVTGTFAGAYKTKISGGNGYDTLTLAHGNAADNATILARELHNATSLAAEPFTENLTVTKPITLKGGYNAAFSSNAGLYSTLAGILTIGGTSGSLTVENLIIK
ncbi:M6 family metalloprotease domain-containing protein [Trichlorobacter lovleyi]|uniref:M6 family metalloprotease domain-containing protein n=1 Tax=Trichlorobacter lovleyi TaxID=313985 RepID=UPI0024800DB2|nr:M6 family metalloprotease domain-containing protein [Trichlorobacter lovleyi]